MKFIFNLLIFINLFILNKSLLYIFKYIFMVKKLQQKIEEETKIILNLNLSENATTKRKKFITFQSK